MQNRDSHNRTYNDILQRLEEQKEDFVATKNDIWFLTQHINKPEDFYRYKQLLKGICKYIRSTNDPESIFGEWGVDNRFIDYKDSWTEVERKTITDSMKTITKSIITYLIKNEYKYYPTENVLRHILHFWIQWPDKIEEFVDWFYAINGLDELVLNLNIPSEKLYEYIVDELIPEEIESNKSEIKLVVGKLKEIVG